MPAESPNPAAGRQWTPEQLAGITTSDRAVLVSAAAGSGKTAVLSERCVHLVTDASPRCDIDQLLVVTFGNEAADEMKHRITGALRQRYSMAPSTHLQRQLALIEHTQISTLHAFCTSMIRRHFRHLELDPDVSILAAEDAALLLRETARNLFDARYASDAAESFCGLIDTYGDGDDQVLMKELIRAHHQMSSLVDPARWMKQAYDRIRQAADDLMNSPMGQELTRLIHNYLSSFIAQTDDMTRLIPPIDALARYVVHVQDIRAILDRWRNTFDKEGYDTLAKMVQGEAKPRLPTIRAKDIPGKEEAQKLIKELKKAIFEGPLSKLLRFSIEELSAGLERTLPYLREFLSLVRDLGESFAAAKRAQNAVDFSDLERMTLRLLAESTAGDVLRPSPVARQCHRQFRHVLVDEYQDINPVQDAILTLVSTDGLARSSDEPRIASNLFCVGDIKQSIYRFRMAEPRRFLDRRAMMSAEQSPHAEYGRVIDLQANFRSRAPLLNAINEVFSRVMRADAVEIEYDASQELRAGRAYPDAPDVSAFPGAPIELHLLPKIKSMLKDIGDDQANTTTETDDDESDSDDDTDNSSDDEARPPFNEDTAERLQETDCIQLESRLLARRIQALMGQDGAPRRSIVDTRTGLYRPIEYGDMVILLRVMAHKARHVAEILRQNDIPVYTDGGEGFFEAQEIRDVLALLNLLDNARQDIPLAAVLRSPFANIPDVESAMAHIRASHRAGDFHEAVAQYAGSHDDELSRRLADLFATLTRWRQLLRNRPLAEALWIIYEQSGYLIYCSGLHDGAQRVANLHQIHEYAAKFGTFQRQGLYRFLWFMDAMKEDEEDLAPASAPSDGGAVRIMSVHHAKGLEFPVVLVPDLGKRFNDMDWKGQILVDRENYIGMSVVDDERKVRYPSLSQMIVKDVIRQKVLAEELRLLYVAMTRAREHLILVGSDTSKKFETWNTLWNGHVGALPAEKVLAATSMLDWVGPASAAINNVGSIEPVVYSAMDVQAWMVPTPWAQKATQWERDRAALRPLNPSPAPDPTAEVLIQRLTRTYPFESFVNLSASKPVTAMVHDDQTATSSPHKDGNDFLPSFADRTDPALGPQRDPTSDPDADAPVDRLALPGFLNDQLASASGAERGTATHLVFQFLDFARPCTGDDLSRQIQTMRLHKQLTDEQVSLVDVQAVEWFMAGPLGQLLSRATTIWREIPFDMALAPQRLGAAPSADPFDSVMLRGRIDLLLADGPALHVIDYKTDRISAAHVPLRSLTYRRQLELYRESLGRVLPDRPVSLHLVYLTPRVIDTW